MKSVLLAALFLISTQYARASDFGPLLMIPSPETELSIHVVNYKNILAHSGDTLRCMKSGNRFGYLITRQGDDYVIDVISNGLVEGEKSRMRAKLKDYGSPFIVYLSVFNRHENYGNYFELLLHKKVNDFLGSLTADAMYTEAYYSKEADKEKETFKPIWKERLLCEMGQRGLTP